MESRIKNIYYGTIRQGVQMYNKTTVEPYVSLNYIKSNKCSEILSDFFKKKRKKWCFLCFMWYNVYVGGILWDI